MTTPPPDLGVRQGGSITVHDPVVSDQAHLHIGHTFNNITQERDRLLEHLRATDPTDDKRRIERTAGGVLRESYSWVLRNDDFLTWRDGGTESSVLWVSGNPGKGKTMLLCGAIDELQKSVTTPMNLSFFFCQAADERINTATSVLRGLAYLLATQQESLESHIRKKYDKAGRPLFEDPNAWDALSDILASMLKDPALKKTYLVIDALDECRPNDLPCLLEFIMQNSSSPLVKWVISSRNDPSIERTLAAHPTLTRLSLERNAENVSKAVDYYIENRVSELFSGREDPELQGGIHAAMREQAQGTFLWVAIVVKELAKVNEWDMVSVIKETPRDLDELYGRMMRQIQLLQKRDPEYCRLTLRTVVTAFRPLRIDELGVLSGLPKAISERPKYVEKIVKLCRCFVTIEGGLVYIVHQSAKTFLLKALFDTGGQEEQDDDAGPGGESLAVASTGGIRAQHRAMLSRSLDAMSSTLRRDMYDLRTPGYPIDQVKTPETDPLASVSYSCLHWVKHLVDSGSTADGDLRDVDEFLQNSYIYWLEALSLLKGMPEGITSLVELDLFLQDRLASRSRLAKLVRDARRFIQYHKSTIETSPLQVYASALIFSPTGSIVKRLFDHESPDWVNVRPRLEKNWKLCSQTIQVHDGDIISLEISPDGHALASFDDQTIKIWNPITGSLIQALRGHIFHVKTTAFSPTSRQLMSMSAQETKFWDLETGRCIWSGRSADSLDGMAAFLPDGRCAILSDDKNSVQIWDPTAGGFTRTLVVCTEQRMVESILALPDSRRLACVVSPISFHSPFEVEIYDLEAGEHHTLRFDKVNFAAFSPDSSCLAAAFHSTIEIRNIVTGDCTARLDGRIKGDIPPAKPVKFFAFTPDSRRVVSVSNNVHSRGEDDASYGGREHDLTAWDLTTGSCLWTLTGTARSVTNVSFSPDSQWVAFAQDYMSVVVSKLEGDFNKVLKGHINMVKLAVFSPNGRWLASASTDATIKLWDTGSWTCAHTLFGHTGPINTIRFSHDSRHLASASSDTTIRVWDMQAIEESAAESASETMPGNGGASWVNSLTFSPNGHQIMSAFGITVNIWEPRVDNNITKLRGHTSWVNSAKYSPTGRRLASASDDNTVRMWDPVAASCVSTLTGHSSWVTCIAFSPDGCRLVSGSDDNTARVWDLANESCPRILQGHTLGINSVTFSPDGNRVASASSDHTVRLWDPETGESIKILEGHTSPVGFVTFSPNGQWLVSTSHGTAKIWHPATGKCALTLEHHNSSFIAFSSSGHRLATLTDHGMEIWDLTAMERTCVLNADGASRATLAVFSPDNKSLASLHAPGTVRLWNLAKGSCTSTLHVEKDISRDTIAFSPDSRQLALGVSSESSLELRGARKELRLQETANFSGDFEPVAVPRRLNYKVYGIGVDCRWVMKNGREFLWLPHEYRPSSAASILTIDPSTMAFTSSSGRVIVIGFAVDEAEMQEARDLYHANWRDRGF
ncbi:uncharacterized protein DNG_09110 [Cephalotrichum gorgonifer]|uniref:NACHT domain-containing protein n=1 Tax=Cephalotrichum gorgonifer TaxID=2041049 RepID=A0AAE8SYZ6_9PEZI|nr:uncharacterized protein DNG_09110 [Cephalotrichum gorgonifer]